MIESIGYTDDGFVWVNILFNRTGENESMLLTMTQGKAREISKMLIVAADEAEQKHRMMQ